MYTQCPECGVAFRVTAEVLKQAAGKVRCGGCGIAFNALAHLSEKKPAAPVKPEPAVDPQVPELTPDEPGELEAGTPPQSISAEQSAALLKTLDQLAGSDIRIEDTGVEWRVLDTDDEDSPEPELDLIADTGSMKFIIEGEEEIKTDDEPSQVIDEMRFDDNTPLPEDFDLVSEPVSAHAPVVEPPPPPVEPENVQVDLALGDPDEWEDLLGDLVEPEEASEPEEPEALEEPEVPEEPELIEDAEDIGESADDLVVLADAQSEDHSDKPLDMDTQFAIQAEAMGIDLSGIHEAVDEAETEAEPEDDGRETSIEEDLIAAAFEAEAAVQAMEETATEETLEDQIDDEAEDETDDEAPDDADDEVEDEPVEDAGSIDDDLDDDEETDVEMEIDLEPEDEIDTDDDVEDIALAFDNDVEHAIETISASLDDEPEEEAAEPSVEHTVLEMTEEEKTINMMIDQELFNIAVEDEDGFASTIVQLQPNKQVDDEVDDNKKEKKAEAKEEDKGKAPPAVETIIMEGEFVRGELDRERLAADKAAESRRFDDPGVSIPLPKGKDDYLRRRQTTFARPGIGTIAGAIVLVLLLLLQAMHQSRTALATVPAFNSTVGPLYRMLGQPLTPTWNISGWRFEATKGSTDDMDQLLTIYSRVGNNSDQALPYPLVHLSLTDRYEDIIGSTVLEPGEYLAQNADPRKLVPPGNTFNAVITIESPSDEATGFKLNVCYRLASGQLRCAIEDFK